MHKPDPSFMAYCPLGVLHNKNLPHGAKILFMDIISLTKKKGYCYAHNRYFRELYEVSGTTVWRWLKALEAEGLITCHYISENERKIYVNFSAWDKFRTMDQDCTSVNPIHTDEKPPSQKEKGGVNDNEKHIYTVINTDISLSKERESTHPKSVKPKPKKKPKSKVLEAPHEAAKLTDSVKLTDTKHAFGEDEAVYLTAEEHKKLKDKYGEQPLADMIERLNDYICSTGKRYKSHYHALKTWFSREAKNAEDNPKRHKDTAPKTRSFYDNAF